MSLGLKIKSLRTEKGLTQRNFADEMGVAVQTIQRTESGERIPNIIEMHSMASVLGVNLSVLINAALKEENEISNHDDSDINYNPKSLKNSFISLNASIDRFAVFFSDEDCSFFIKTLTRSLSKIKKIRDTKQKMLSAEERNLSKEEIEEKCAEDGFTDEEINYLLSLREGASK